MQSLRAELGLTDRWWLIHMVVVRPQKMHLEARSHGPLWSAASQQGCWLAQGDLSERQRKCPRQNPQSFLSLRFDRPSLLPSSVH